jgi:ribosomal protein S4E
MANENAPGLKDGDRCLVFAGTHKGKSGIARDVNISKSGHLTITIVQKDGTRFKTLGRNVEVKAK